MPQLSPHSLLFLCIMMFACLTTLVLIFHFCAQKNMVLKNKSNQNIKKFSVIY